MNQGLTQQKSAPPRWLFWLTLILTLCVILWGAYVRISGSGAGCGRDWPLCKKLFAESSAQTLVEFVHRATSGLTLILIFVQGVWVLRTHSKRHPARGAAIASMILIITESLIGAALVLKELVALNTSVARGIWIALHLTNTFLLLAALLITLQWSTRDHFHVEWRKARLWLGALALILTTGIAGAISALSDTLFPAVGAAIRGMDQPNCGRRQGNVRLSRRGRSPNASGCLRTAHGITNAAPVGASCIRFLA